MLNELLDYASELHQQLEELKDMQESLHLKTVMVFISVLNELYKNEWLSNTRIILGHEQKEHGSFFCFNQIHFQLDQHQSWIYRDSQLNPWIYYENDYCYPFDRASGVIKTRLNNHQQESLLLTALYAFINLQWTDDLLQILQERYSNQIIKSAPSSLYMDTKLYYFYLTKEDFKNFGSLLSLHNYHQYWKEIIEMNLPENILENESPDLLISKI